MIEALQENLLQGIEGSIKLAIYVRWIKHLPPRNIETANERYARRIAMPSAKQSFGMLLPPVFASPSTFRACQIALRPVSSRVNPRSESGRERRAWLSLASVDLGKIRTGDI